MVRVRLVLVMMQYGGLLRLGVTGVGVGAEFNAWLDIAPQWP